MKDAKRQADVEPSGETKTEEDARKKRRSDRPSQGKQVLSFLKDYVTESKERYQQESERRAHEHKERMEVFKGLVDVLKKN